MIKHLILPLFLIVVYSAVGQNILYEFAAPNAVHHEAEITITAQNMPPGPLLFKMSRSSPGRYATHEFGKNVYNVSAVNATGKALKLEKVDGDVYKVSAHHGLVKLTYTLYANYADGTYANIDDQDIHLNMPATFMWIKGMEKTPIKIHFKVADQTWKVATQLIPGKDAFTFTAPDLQYFMDSPTKIATLNVKEWIVTNPDKKQYKFRLALQADTMHNMLDTFAGKLAKMVTAAQQVFGEVPAYDYGTYTFIASINPYVKGDGMEHRNSTMITLPAHFTGDNGQLDVFSHEFFHCWNVERIRPKSIEPFNFEKSNMCDALWLAEGFTQYYGNLILVRAGLKPVKEYLPVLSGLINEKNNTPGATLYSPIENSQRAVFVDAGTSIDRTNYSNMFTSYYSYGAAIAMALDLELRGKFDKTLDDVMKELWKKHGQPQIPYTIADVQTALASVTGNKDYAAGFFTHYIYGHHPFNYKTLLQNAGMNVSEANGLELGSVSLLPVKGGLAIQRPTIRNTPLYNAGLDVGDIIVSIGARAMQSVRDVEKLVESLKPNDDLEVSYIHKGRLLQTRVHPAINGNVTVTEFPQALTPAQVLFRKKWLEAR